MNIINTSTVILQGPNFHEYHRAKFYLLSTGHKAIVNEVNSKVKFLDEFNNSIIDLNLIQAIKKLLPA